MKKKNKQEDPMVNLAEFGRIVGRTRAQISKLCKTGDLTRDKSGKLFREAALAEYAAYLAGGSETVSTGQPAKGVYLEIAQSRLEFQKLKIVNQELSNEIQKTRMEIQTGRYIDTAKAGKAVSWQMVPVMSECSSLIARMVWVIAQSQEKAIELQDIFENGIRFLLKKASTRNFEREKDQMVAAADEVLSGGKDGKELAKLVREIYGTLDPALVSKVGVKLLAYEGDLEPIPDQGRLENTVLSITGLGRNHDLPGSPVIFVSRTSDVITLHFPNEETTQQFILGLLGAPRPSIYRTPVVMSADLANIKFESKIGDPKMPPKYKDRKELTGEEDK
jgi:hypothetical protein